MHRENLIWEQRKCSIRRGSIRSGEVILDENRLGEEGWSRDSATEGPGFWLG